MTKRYLVTHPNRNVLLPPRFWETRDQTIPGSFLSRWPCTEYKRKEPGNEVVTDLETAVNSDLENLRKWLIANKLSLNVAKTEFMLIGSKPTIKNISDSCPNVYIENIQIKQVHECKTLGVTIDQHLSWKSNTENICKKVTAGISAIRRIKPFVDQDTLILIYNTIVRPYFDYCCEVWDVFGETQSKRLQKL